MTEGSLAVLNFLKSNQGKEFTKHQIVKHIGVNMHSVNGSVNWLLNKGFAVARVEEIPSSGEKISFISITESGMAYDPDEVERKKAQLKMEQLAKRKEDRRRQKAERARLNSVL